MPATYEPIATVTANGTASDYEFTSIPSTYTDLVLVGMARGAKSANDVLVQGYINFDFSNSYSATWMQSDGSSATSSRSTGNTGLYLGNIPAASSTSGIFGTIIIHYQNYTNTTTNKTIIARTGSSLSLRGTVGLYRSTAAITRVGIATYGDGNFVSGSTFTLYGIKAA